MKKYYISLGVAVGGVLALAAGREPARALPRQADFVSGRGFSPVGVLRGWVPATMHSLNDEIRIVDATARMAAEQDGLGTRDADTFDPMAAGSTPQVDNNQTLDPEMQKRLKEQAQKGIFSFDKDKDKDDKPMFGQRDLNVERGWLIGRVQETEFRESKWSVARESESLDTGDLLPDAGPLPLYDDAPVQNHWAGGFEESPAPPAGDAGGFRESFSP